MIADRRPLARRGLARSSMSRVELFTIEDRFLIEGRGAIAIPDRLHRKVQCNPKNNRLLPQVVCWLVSSCEISKDTDPTLR